MRKCKITESGVRFTFVKIEAFYVLSQNGRRGLNGLYHKKERFVLKLIKEK
jgi:hypothetical protein